MDRLDAGRTLHGVDEDRKKGGDGDDRDLHQVIDAEEQDKRWNEGGRRDWAKKLEHGLEHPAQQRHQGKGETDDRPGRHAEDITNRHPIESCSDHRNEIAGERAAGESREDHAHRRPVLAPHEARARGQFPGEEKDCDEEQTGSTV
jgi:hypothetical protein